MTTSAGKKLNIAHLHWGFPPLIGGVTHLTILLPNLAERGHAVSLLTGAVEDCKVEDTYRDVRITRAPIMDLNWLTRRGLAGIEEEVRTVFDRFVEENRPDILHAHNMHYFSKVHAKGLEAVAEKRGIPLILTAHNVWDDEQFFELTRRVKWTHIVAVSHFIKKELIGIGCPHRQITVIHHGVDAGIFRPDIDPAPIYAKYPQLQLKGKKVFFHPARIGLAKGCDISIKALNLVKAKVPEAMLVLAGTKNIIDWGLTQQKDIAYLVHLVEEFNLRERVLIDSYDLSEMPLLYAASLVCVYPSTAFEPFGLTMLEAMASGRPMIVTNAGGMPEIIQNGVNGYVIPMKGYEELAAHVVHLFNDDDLRERLGTTGRKMIETRFKSEDVAEATLNLYRRFV